MFLMKFSSKINVYLNKCLSRPIITRKIETLGYNLLKQVQERAKYFFYFSIALDSSSDGTTQLPIFIRGVNDNCEITEELGTLKKFEL